MSVTPDEIAALVQKIRLHNWGENVENYAFPSEIADALEEVAGRLIDPERPPTWARCDPKKYHSKSSAYADGYDQGWRDRQERASL